MIAALVVLVIGMVLVFEGVKFITVYLASSLPVVVVGMVLLVSYCALVGDSLNVRFKSESMFIPLFPPLVVMGLVLLWQAYAVNTWYFAAFGVALLIISYAGLWAKRGR